MYVGLDFSGKNMWTTNARKLNSSVVIRMKSVTVVGSYHLKLVWGVECVYKVRYKLSLIFNQPEEIIVFGKTHTP